MSSALPVDPRGANQQAYRLGEMATSGGGARRQTVLNKRYSYFRGNCYDDRRIDWQGDAITDPSAYDTSGVMREQNIPPGFTDSYGNTAPLKFRRPSAPYYLARVIVKRFTGLLFSHRKHPKVKVDGDPITEDYLAAAIEAGRLWAQMIEARDLGGSMGSVAVGFEIADGIPLFEVFDPRYATPHFKNRLTRELGSIEIKWTYTDWVQNEKEEWFEGTLWSRRVIDDQTDTIWQGIYTPDGKEPDWEAVATDPDVKPEQTEHGFGFCPVEWIQNVAVNGEIDGDPDCHGAYDLFEEIDKLTAQANKGIIANCDPTLVMETDDELASVEKGSEKFIRVNKGEGANYLEINGAGCKLAVEQADRLEDKALRLVQCVLDQARSAVSKTATEVDRDYSSFYEKGDVLREQYGERGVKRLCVKLIMASRMLEAAGTPLVLPPRMEVQADGTKKYVARKLGNSSGSGVMTLAWPGYTSPSTDDAVKAVNAAGTAKNMGLVDDEKASQFVAGVFQVEDVRPMLAAMAKKKADEEAAFADQTVQTGAVKDGVTTFFQYEMEAGIVTINEMRGAKGLPALAMDGDLTVPQYKFKYQNTFAKATMTANEVGAEKILGISDDTKPKSNGGSIMSRIGAA